MYVKDLITNVEKTKTYKDFMQDHPDYYLVHVFFMTDADPQVGYFNPKTEQIVTFDISRDVRMNAPSDVFKQENSIEELKVEDIKLDRTDAMDKMTEVRNEHYPREMLSKEVMILQVLDKVPVYNITYFTKTFKTLNVKIDASSGNVVSHDLANLIGL